MPAHHRLWTGPPGAALRDCLLAELGGEPGGLWIVPTPLARDQVARELAIGTRVGGKEPRVYSWDDLWREIFSRVSQGPSWLSESAARAVFREAVSQVHNQGLIPSKPRNGRPTFAIVSCWPGSALRMTRGFRSGRRSILSELIVRALEPGRTLRSRGHFSNMRDPRPPTFVCWNMPCGGAGRSRSP